jgi:hypothetical protein
MAKEILYSYLDPEVLLAISNSIKLYDECEACEDASAKKAFGKMVRDALKFEAEIELKSRAKEAIQILHDLETPVINLN